MRGGGAERDRLLRSMPLNGLRNAFRGGFAAAVFFCGVSGSVIELVAIVSTDLDGPFICQVFVCTVGYRFLTSTKADAMNLSRLSCRLLYGLLYKTQQVR